MKKVDFKKLALMGIAGGCMLSAQGTANEPESKINAENETLLAGRSHQDQTYNGNNNNAGNKNGSSCGSKPSNGCNTHREDIQNTPANGTQQAPQQTQPQPAQGNGCESKNPTMNNGTLLAGGSCGGNGGGCGGANSGSNNGSTNRNNDSTMADKRSNLQQDSVNATPVENIRKSSPPPAPINVRGKNGTVVNPQPN